MPNIKENLINNIIDLENQIQDLNEKLSKLKCELENLKDPIDFNVGDKVITSNNETGEVISVNGREGAPIIVLIHQKDYDDIYSFDNYGIINIHKIY